MKVKLICQSPAGRNRTTWIDSCLAWSAARGIARDTHECVVLYGTYGVVRFDSHGAGYVEWNDKATIPGEKTRFDERTVVCVN